MTLVKMDYYFAVCIVLFVIVGCSSANEKCGMSESPYAMMSAAGPPVAPVECPQGVAEVQCFAEPCDVQNCPRFPKACCQNDYCGSCGAKFFINGRREVTKQCGG
ncbi:hypothetical protein RvY_11078 [Ramazzottius varieornatus]|uniref:Uncharacterized protein n=1 Tax=Ramazzottius varieornatus TaxID=947166 RepID=A0A1D1VMR5_RAMVA|nr:hypothetical protein RvY_11078 [Ramazzottius varieornatus]